MAKVNITIEFEDHEIKDNVEQLIGGHLCKNDLRLLKIIIAHFEASEEWEEVT